LRFFSPPEKPSLTDQLHPLLGEREKIHRVELFEPALLANRIERRTQEIEVADAGDLDRILERQKDAGDCPLFRRQGEQVPALIAHRARGHLVAVAACEHLGERALARAVGPHDGVHLARVHL